MTALGLWYLLCNFYMDNLLSLPLGEALRGAIMQDWFLCFLKRIYNTVHLCILLLLRSFSEDSSIQPPRRSCRRKNSKMKSYRSSANERREERFTTMSAASPRPVLKQRPVTFTFVREALITPVLICFTVTADVRLRPGVRARRENPGVQILCFLFPVRVRKMGILFLTRTTCRLLVWATLYKTAQHWNDFNYLLKHR